VADLRHERPNRILRRTVPERDENVEASPTRRLGVRAQLQVIEDLMQEPSGSRRVREPSGAWIEVERQPVGPLQ
jgi:hypothetical protein